MFNASTVVTRPGEYRVVRQFGKIVRVDTVDSHAYGLGFKIPFIQSDTAINSKLMLYDLAASDVMTSDKKSMISERNNIAASYTAQGEQQALEIKNDTDEQTTVILAQAQKTADTTIAEGEAEYMRILSEAYNDTSKADFYSFVRQLDAVKATLKNGENTIVLDKDSPIAKIFYQMD